MVVVGAGPACCAAVTALRHTEARLVLLERGLPGKDKPCGDGFVPAASFWARRVYADSDEEGLSWLRASAGAGDENEIRAVETMDANDDIPFLDGLSSWPSLRKQRATGLDLLRVQAGERILDVGCGLGDVVRELSVLAGPSGWVVGVDHSESMLAEARKRTEGTLHPIEYRLGDARHLDFTDDTFDASRAERLLVNLEDPYPVLSEMLRVTRPGGRIVIAEPDLGTVVLRSPDRSLTRKVFDLWCDTFPNGWIGRQLFGLFQEMGLDDVEVLPVTVTTTDYQAAQQGFSTVGMARRAQKAGVISPGEAARWLEGLEKTHQERTFFSACTFFIVAGRKPG